MKKDIRTLLDLSKRAFEFLLQRASELKNMHKSGLLNRPLQGKILGLMFGNNLKENNGV
ncbi:MAG: hypothetical protein JSV38_14510 [Desulfobacterales bacterium]|nr:MAG: hypothetical protein JSV38_14510 [Desulfobacterales bacterium]